MHQRKKKKKKKNTKKNEIYLTIFNIIKSFVFLKLSKIDNRSSNKKKKMIFFFIWQNVLKADTMFYIEIHVLIHKSILVYIFKHVVHVENFPLKRNNVK